MLVQESCVTHENFDTCISLDITLKIQSHLCFESKFDLIFKIIENENFFCVNFDINNYNN
jgi:hypothetical protein